MIDAELLAPWRGAARWWAGFSGGLDSTVLLHWLAGVDERPPLAAIHINHGLHPEADAWEAHCRRECEALGVAFHRRAVRVRPAGEGPEAAARKARYGAFEEALSENEVLFLAHHADDQVETFFLRVLRGAGSRGLSAMPPARPLRGATGAASCAGEDGGGGDGGGSGSDGGALAGHAGDASPLANFPWLARPLLGVRRAELEAYAREHGLAWVEDSGNADERLDRNFLRHRVLPLLEERWPAYRGSVLQSIAALQNDAADIEAAFRPLLQAAAGHAFGEPVLDLRRTGALTPSALSRLLRLWLRELGMESPGRAELAEFIRQLDTLDIWDGGETGGETGNGEGNGGGRETGNGGGGEDGDRDRDRDKVGGGGSAPRLQLGGDYCLQRYRQHIHLRPCLPPPEEGEWRIAPGETLELPGVGTLSMQPVPPPDAPPAQQANPAGQAPPANSTAVNPSAPAEPVGLRLPPDGFWRVAYRKGGERCRPVGRSGSRSLKKLLQEFGIPPWQRGRLPLLYAGSEIAAVAGFCLCAANDTRAAPPPAASRAAPPPAYRPHFTPRPAGIPLNRGANSPCRPCSTPRSAGV